MLDLDIEDLVSALGDAFLRPDRRELSRLLHRLARPLGASVPTAAVESTA